MRKNYTEAIAIAQAYIGKECYLHRLHSWQGEVK